jgi:hypothetical protein
VPWDSDESRRKLASTLIKGAVIVIAAIGAMDEAHYYWSRTKRKSAWWLSNVERREQRRFQVAELVYLIRRLTPS